MPTVQDTVDPRQGPDISHGETIPLEDAEGQARPNIRPSGKFLLYWTPGVGCYQMRRTSNGEPVLVPRIQVLRGSPGIGGVAGGDGAALNFSRPVRDITQRGGVVLDARTCRAHKVPSYLRAHKLAKKDTKGNDTFAHLPPWRYPRRTRSGGWTIECDEDVKTRWEATMLAAGVIPQPEPEDLRAMLERRANRISRHMTEKDMADKVAHQLEQADYAAELAAIEAAGFVVDETDASINYEAPGSAELPDVQEVLDA